MSVLPVLVGVLIVVAAACSSGGAGGGSDEPVAAVTTQPEADPAAEPAEDVSTTVTEPSSPEPADEPADGPADEPADEPADGPADEPADEPAGEPADEPAGPPHTVRLRWGNFELSDRIAAKLASGEPLNFVISVEATGDEHSAVPLGHGWSLAAAAASEAYGVDIAPRVVGPNEADAEAQAGTVESLLAAGDIDCLAVQAANPGLMDDTINNAVDAGVPVFAVGGDSPDSKRFAFYGIDDFAAGEAVGQAVGQWAADGSILVRVAGLLTGDAGDQGSFDLMQGFVAGLSEIHSGVVWANNPNNVDAFGFDPVTVRAAIEAWVLENSDADIVFHTGAGLESLAAVMADQLLYGDMYAVGFHMSPQVSDYIRERLVVATVVARLAAQTRLAGMACGDFLLGGVHETGHVVIEPLIVTRENVDEIDWSQPENL